jgi:hypothetical protein
MYGKVEAGGVIGPVLVRRIIGNNSGDGDRLGLVLVVQQTQDKTGLDLLRLSLIGRSSCETGRLECGKKVEEKGWFGKKKDGEK